MSVLIHLIVGAILLIAALHVAAKLKPGELTDVNLVKDVAAQVKLVAMIVLLTVGIILVGGSSYVYNVGSPVYAMDTFAGIPEGQIFVVDTIVANGDESVLWLVVPYLRQDTKPIYVEVCKENLLDAIVVGDKIVRDGYNIKKIV